MDLDTILLECEDHMDKAVEYLRSEMKGIRTGRASTALVEFIKIDYYGSMTDLRQLANISVPEATQILVKPYDKSALQAVVKGIQAAGLGLNPVAEGDQLRINLPPLSTERRQQLVGSVKQMAEHSKIAIRNSRRDANKHVDQLEKDKKSEVTEDMARSAKEEIQDYTKKHEAAVDELVASKEKEIMEV